MKTGTRLFWQHGWLGLWLFALVIVLVGSGITRAAPQRDEPKDGIISAQADGRHLSTTRAWSVAAMQAAQPYPAPTNARAHGDNSSPRKVKPNGPMGSLPGKAPHGVPTAPKSDDISRLSYGIPDGWYRYYPYSTVGKLFFKQYGNEYACSAALIKGHGLWTAGHCVHAGNNSPDGWSYDVVFVPQYNNGWAPLGQCIVYNLWTTWDWYSNGNPHGLDHDYAGGAISCNVTFSTGWLGLAWNQPYDQYYTMLGYPADYPFTGGKMIGCGSYRTAYGFGSPTTFGITCDMTGGSSGGPALIWGTHINGNVSYGDRYYPGLIFSPYYDSNVKVLWDALPN